MEALVRGWRDAWQMPQMPFYFTQMQCYGSPNPDSVGFADIRQAQHQFFINNRDNVGMVVQSDLNSARPQGIHYQNKLHPGMRMARWALAKQYGKDIDWNQPKEAPDVEALEFDLALVQFAKQDATDQEPTDGKEKVDPQSAFGDPYTGPEIEDAGCPFRKSVQLEEPRMEDDDPQNCDGPNAIHNGDVVR